MLGKKVVGPRSGVVLAHDPAVNLALSDWRKYEDSLYGDEGALVLVEGCKPTRWSIRPLTRRQKNALSGYADNPRSLAEFVFRCGALRVEGYRVEDEHGAERFLEEPPREAVGAMGDLVKESWLDEVDPPREDIDGVATAILRISEARPLSCRRSEPAAGRTA